MTDLGTLGLTGSGFEVAAPDVAGLGGFVGTTADATAVTTGRAVEQVGPETSLQYEGSVGYRRARWRAELTAFVNTIDGNISGPVIRDRLSLNFTVNDNKKENVGTVKAELPTGPFSLGVTRPTLNRSYDLRSVLQLADAHSLNMDFKYATVDSKNENVGDFVLPERASRTKTQNYVVDLREISILSERTVHDVHFIWRKDHSDTNPFSTAPAIIVKDAFTGGGAQNKNRSDGNQYDLSNLIYFAGETLTMRSGFQATHRRKRSVSQENFFGEWTFSDLASYQAGKPLKYRITCCDPLSRLSQTQVALFSQNDFKLSRTFTLMLGARYQIQTNIRDRNQVDPRIGFAYALGNSTVIRGGGGVFSQWVSFGQLETVSRLDGKRIYEIQIDNPGWPDPLASGSVRPRSRRQLAPNTKMAIYPVFQIGVEQSLPNNLFVTVSWDRVRAIKPIRTRDINAPLPETGVRPNPDEGQVFQYQSSGFSTTHHLKASLRQRFSIFVATANYTFMHFMTDQEDRRGGDIYLPVDNYNLWKEWGRAVDPRHDFSSSINARLPLDVYLTTIIRARSGGFYTITTGKDDNKDGVSNDRPFGVVKNSEVGPGYFDVSFNFITTIIGRRANHRIDRRIARVRAQKFNRAPDRSGRPVPISIRIGSRSAQSARSAISGGRVAEKNKV
jgi:hypothetical protein